METVSRATIEEKLKEILISEVNVNPASLAETDSNTALLGRGIGLDSMEAMALAVEMENAFDIQIADDEMTEETFRTIGAFVDFIQSKIAEGRGRDGGTPE